MNIVHFFTLRFAYFINEFNNDFKRVLKQIFVFFWGTKMSAVSRKLLNEAMG